jgi:hypothetical protein
MVCLFSRLDRLNAALADLSKYLTPQLRASRLVSLIPAVYAHFHFVRLMWRRRIRHRELESI